HGLGRPAPRRPAPRGGPDGLVPRRGPATPAGGGRGVSGPAPPRADGGDGAAGPGPPRSPGRAAGRPAGPGPRSERRGPGWRAPPPRRPPALRPALQAAMSPVRSTAAVVLLLALGLAAGCASPVGVTRMSPDDVQRALTASALSTRAPSVYADQVLQRNNLREVFESDPAAALAQLHATLPARGAENRLFALAELSFLHAEVKGGRPYYL